MARAKTGTMLPAQLGMRVLRPSSDGEMASAFLAAEATSPRYGPQTRKILVGLEPEPP
ncbi:MAG TPA: hypothetical protein VIV12_12115 [Streptosporangiaceae bacterium]